MPLTRTVNLHRYSNSNSGDNVSTVNLDPITYNPRYPWFDETNYRKLESKIDSLGLTWYDKEKAMDDLYIQVLPKVQDDIKNSERRKYINDASYEVSQIQDSSARLQAKWKLTVTELAQKLKETFNIDPSANDEEVFNSWIESIPNGWQLLADYMNNGNRELLYEWGLAKKMEAPEVKESSVWGIQSIINKQSEIDSDSTLWKLNNAADRVNLPWKITEWIDSLVQKIPTLTYEEQVENLANKINNLSEDEMSKLYDQYVAMIKNWSDEKWKDDKRNWYELFWDAITWDEDAVDRLNTLHLYDYSEAMPQDWIERNQRWSQAWDKLVWADKDTVNKAIEDSNSNAVVKWLAKAWAWTADKAKNLLNFVWWSWGWLENYAESLGVWLQQLDDIRDMRSAPTQWLENNEDAFNTFVADKTANFGEYITDAPKTLLGKPVTPNAAKFISNIPQSFFKLLSWQVRGKTNPLDTKVWLLKMLFTEEWQQAMIDRYWTLENLANTMNTDPVWLADDMIDRADKFNMVTSKASWGRVPRRSIGSLTDALSDSAVKNINSGLSNVSNYMRNKGFNRTANLVDLERDVSTNPSMIKEDTKKIAKQWAEDIVDASKTTAEFVSKIPETFSKKSEEVWEKAKETATRDIPEKVVENDLKLTPTERANVEKNGTTAANFVLKEWIGWLKNEDKIVALQDIATDAYNKVTETFKDKIPQTERVKSADAPKMLQIMADTMEKSDIVKSEYGDYINKLKEMKDYSDYSPYELLAIRRDFDAIVWNDIFNSKGRVTWLEDQIIAWYRASLNDKINEIWDKYWLDVRDQNSRISNSITIRDWLIRANSQWKKNNYIWLKDLWIWAVLSAWNPIVWTTAVIGSKIWDAKSWKLAQSVYNLNKESPKKTNTRKWPWFIKKTNTDASSRFMISSSSNNSSSNWSKGGKLWKTKSKKTSWKKS